ncbi:hypothetical protein RD792_013881 [Penstemon davidsonii]|uniref:CASP-like protein n=1 Tax=Penstemon davidsonii TaxID=160366 RepID=A0ABR0CNH5_9LAMI|nr:hypothetical protein RD792_013881 [Penstemon davidsonii]
MTNPNDESKPENVTQSPPPPVAVDLEGGGGAISNIIRRWKREDLLNRGCLATRGFCFVFSLLAFIIMASNKHGDWKDFDKYEEYNYVLAIAILSTLYSGLQALRQVHQFHTAREFFSRRNLAMIEFLGDQVMAYLLISSASSAVPLTNRMREGADNIFTDSSASAIAMAFFAFFSLAISSLISGYKLSNQSYI